MDNSDAAPVLESRVTFRQATWTREHPTILKLGKLERGLDEAGAHGWILAGMKRDWRSIYPAK